MRYGGLNFFVLLIVVFLSFENYETWSVTIQAIPEKEAARKSGEKIENPPGLGTQNEPAPLQSYITIAEKNIFSPERKDFPVQSSPDVKKPVSRPQIILYGVVIADKHQFASIISPGRSLYKGERETKSLKVGERIGEYKLAKILPDRIMMEATGDSFEVLLYDPKMPKKRMELKTEAKPVSPPAMQPAVAPPKPGAPAPASPSASAEAAKPAGPVQEIWVAPLPTTKPARSSPRSRAFRRGGRNLPPPSDIPTQTAPEN